MRLIAHRGNTFGRNAEKENSIDYIEDAINSGFDVELDVRYCENSKLFYLGHDSPKFKVDLPWLLEKSEKLWVHCKDLNSMIVLNGTGLNYFWHQNDCYTLTSREIIWTYPKRRITEKSVIVCQTEENCFHYVNNTNCYGVCSDYVGKMI